MPLKPNTGIWQILPSACRWRLEIRKRSTWSPFEIRQCNPVNYVMRPMSAIRMMWENKGISEEKEINERGRTQSGRDWQGAFYEVDLCRLNIDLALVWWHKCRPNHFLSMFIVKCLFWSLPLKVKFSSPNIRLFWDWCLLEVTLWVWERKGN